MREAKSVQKQLIHKCFLIFFTSKQTPKTSNFGKEHTPCLNLWLLAIHYEYLMIFIVWNFLGCVRIEFFFCWGLLHMCLDKHWAQLLITFHCLHFLIVSIKKVLNQFFFFRFDVDTFFLWYKLVTFNFVFSSDIAMNFKSMIRTTKSFLYYLSSSFHWKVCQTKTSKMSPS